MPEALSPSTTRLVAGGDAQGSGKQAPGKAQEEWQQEHCAHMAGVVQAHRLVVEVRHHQLGHVRQWVLEQVPAQMQVQVQVDSINQCSMRDVEVGLTRSIKLLCQFVVVKREKIVDHQFCRVNVPMRVPFYFVNP